MFADLAIVVDFTDVEKTMKFIHSRHDQPNQFTHIHLIQQIGQGGFGVVYLADVDHVNGFRKRVAIKVLNGEATDFPELLARQRDEARLLGLLNHENIVRVFDYCEVNGTWLIIMEYVSGISISKLMKIQPIPIAVALQIMSDCARALDYAYTTFHPHLGRPLRAIHRDIKPSNVILSKTGQVKLLDFGISRADMDRDAPTSSFQMGTERYMAPEQWLENRSGPEVDVYALGLMGIEMLTGKTLPRLPLDHSIHRTEVERRIQNVCIDAPQIFQDVIRDLFWEMLQFQMDNRPSAEDVYERCSSLVEDVEGETLRQYAFKHNKDMGTNIVELEMRQSNNKFSVGSVLPLSSVTVPDKIDDNRMLLWTIFLILIGIAFWKSVPNEDVKMYSLSQIQNVEPKQKSSIPTNDRTVHITKNIKDRPTKVNSSPKEKTMYTVTISSIPLGAEVFIDGESKGSTLLYELPISEGQHRIRMTWKERDIEKMVTIKNGGRYVWSVHKTGDESWSSY